MTARVVAIPTSLPARIPAGNPGVLTLQPDYSIMTHRTKMSGTLEWWILHQLHSTKVQIRNRNLSAEVSVQPRRFLTLHLQPIHKMLVSTNPRLRLPDPNNQLHRSLTVSQTTMLVYLIAIPLQYLKRTRHDSCGIKNPHLPITTAQREPPTCLASLLSPALYRPAQLQTCLGNLLSHENPRLQ